MKQIVFLSLIICIFSCKEKNNGKQYVSDLQKGFGFVAYDSLDIFSFKGYGMVDPTKPKYPFYLIRSDSVKIDVCEVKSESLTELITYWRRKNYIISTILEQDSELSKHFSRDVIIISTVQKVIYRYNFYDNLERLSYIEISYKNTPTITYFNTVENYYHYSDTLNQANIFKLFPTFKEES